MRKKGKLIVFEEVNGELMPKNNKKQKNEQPFNVHSNEFKMAIVGLTTLIATPSVASAAEKTIDDVTEGIYSTIMSTIDVGVVLIITFAGCAWMLGHRSKAIHLLICVCSGYFIARNAVNIRDFMRSI